jgi:hypothetical protein
VQLIAVLTLLAAAPPAALADPTVPPPESAVAPEDKEEDDALPDEAKSDTDASSASSLFDMADGEADEVVPNVVPLARPTPQPPAFASFKPITGQTRSPSTVDPVLEPPPR